MKKNEKRKNQKKPEVKVTKSGKPSKKIPKPCLENAIAIINDADNVVWKGRSTACEKHIHQHQESISYLSSQSNIFHWELQMRYARDCLIRRDWYNLAQILLLYKPEKGNEHLFPIFAKYASICLAYTNQPLLKSLLQSFGCDKSIEVVLKKWTQITNEANNIKLEEEC